MSLKLHRWEKDTTKLCMALLGGALQGIFYSEGVEKWLDRERKDGKHSVRLMWRAPSTLRTLWTHVGHLWVCLFCARGSREPARFSYSARMTRPRPPFRGEKHLLSQWAYRRRAGAEGAGKETHEDNGGGAPEFGVAERAAAWFGGGGF